MSICGSHLREAFGDDRYLRRKLLDHERQLANLVVLTFDPLPHCLCWKDSGRAVSAFSCVVPWTPEAFFSIPMKPRHPPFELGLFFRRRVNIFSSFCDPETALRNRRQETFNTGAGRRPTGGGRGRCRFPSFSWSDDLLGVETRPSGGSTMGRGGHTIRGRRIVDDVASSSSIWTRVLLVRNEDPKQQGTDKQTNLFVFTNSIVSDGLYL